MASLASQQCIVLDSIIWSGLGQMSTFSESLNFGRITTLSVLELVCILRYLMGLYRDGSTKSSESCFYDASFLGIIKSLIIMGTK